MIAEILGHAIECERKLPEFVVAFHRQARLKVAMRNTLGTCGDALHVTCEVVGQRNDPDQRECDETDPIAEVSCGGLAKLDEVLPHRSSHANTQSALFVTR